MPLLRPFLRDGVDVYVHHEDEVHFVFLATRRRLKIKASQPLIHSLSWMDGEHTANDLVHRFASEYGSARLTQFDAFLAYLQQRGIVVERDWLERFDLPPPILQTQQRQLNFLLDVLESPDKVAAAQSRISRASIAVFGIGAVGSWLVRLLLGIGFRNFTLIDHDFAEPSDITRHAFFDTQSGSIGALKVESLATLIESEFSGASVRAVSAPLTMDTDLLPLIDKATALLINAADEPYIGYTSVLLSRFCIARRLPLLVAGGFDAHLGSIGELIVPGTTPCADCYAAHFKIALKDWTPVPHPVLDRHRAFGGICSLSVFAAAAAAMSALRLFAFDKPDATGGRGELMFDDYALMRFDVARQPDCPSCGSI